MFFNRNKSNHLGRYFQDRRTEKCLKLGQLARLVGYRNISKGANRIARFEREGVVKEELLARLADALNIDLPTVEDLAEQDRQEFLQAWEAWVNEPVPMALVVRYMAGVCGRVELPEHITTPEHAEAYACQLAKERRLRMCLALSRRISVWISAEGTVDFRTEAEPDAPNVPYMRLPCNPRKFLFRFGEGKR